MNCRDTQRTLFTQYDALLCAVSEWGMIWHGEMIYFVTPAREELRTTTR